MLFHPILNQIANLDMAFLVKSADEQRIEGQTACFCPLCQKEEADDVTPFVGVWIETKGCHK